jgi:membrane-associated phospholipid phosphatase
VSGHSAVCAACATIWLANAAWPGQLAVVVLAAMVGGSRVAVGSHLPLDVVGGWALGVLLGSAWNAAADLATHTVAGESPGLPLPWPTSR